MASKINVTNPGNIGINRHFLKSRITNIPHFADVKMLFVPKFLVVDVQEIVLLKNLMNHEQATAAGYRLTGDVWYY